MLNSTRKCAAALVLGLLCLLLQGCDIVPIYSFYISNELESDIVLEFQYTSSRSYEKALNDEKTITLSPGEKKFVRTIDGTINTPAHNCLKQHGMTYSKEIIFDIYIDNVKLEKQLWQPQNWQYESGKGKYEGGKYHLKITEDLISADDDENE